MLLPWLGEMVCHMTLSKIWQAACFFQKMQKLDHSCCNKEKSDLVCFSGRSEAVIIQLPQVENTAFIIRAWFPSSKTSFLAISELPKNTPRTHTIIPWEQMSLETVLSADCHTCCYSDDKKLFCQMTYLQDVGSILFILENSKSWKLLL